MNDITPITISVQYTTDDIRRAQYLLLKHQSKTNGVLRFIVLTALVMLSIIFSLAIEHIWRAVALDEDTIFNVAALLIMAVIYFGAWLFFFSRSASSDIPPHPFVFTFSEEAITVTMPYAESRSTWERWGTAIDDRVMLILIGGNDRCVIPKHAITDPDDLLRLRALIEKKVGGINAELAVKTALPPPPAKSM